MARLPIPGADDGDWGNVLNDYLEQSHTATGELKENVVASSQLQDNAVSEAKLAGAVQTKLNNPNPSLGGALSGTASNASLVAGAVTASAIADGAVTAAKLAGGASSADGLRSLLIFYAPPNIINARYDNDYAAGVLARYDDVVLGAGLQDPGHSDYGNTTAIITKLAALNADTVVWGYIDCGVTTGNYTLAELQTQIDEWIDIGAGGIFCDVIGYAYGVSRTRQNAIIDYIHSKGVGAILNVFNPDEVFSSAVDPVYNPGGTATHANSSDVHLLESWVANTDSYSSPYYATFSDVKTRGDASRSYRNSLGIRIFCVNIVQYSGRTDSEIDAFRGVAEALSRTWRLDGFGVSGSQYAATGADVGVVRPRFPMLRTNPLRRTAPYILNGGWTQVQAPDLGIIVDYDAGTHDYSQL